MGSYIVKDIVMFFLMAVVSVALASFLGEMNEHLYFGYSYQTALVSSPSIGEKDIFNKTDYDIFLECFRQNTNIAHCAKADFNGDGVVDVSDAGFLGALSRFDVNQDGVIILQYPWNGVSDYKVFATCWVLKDTSQDCLSLDFNKDGLVDIDDNKFIVETIRFDLNNNKRVEWR